MRARERPHGNSGRREHVCGAGPAHLQASSLGTSQPTPVRKQGPRGHSGPGHLLSTSQASWQALLTAALLGRPHRPWSSGKAQGAGPGPHREETQP